MPSKIIEEWNRIKKSDRPLDPRDPTGEEERQEEKEYGPKVTPFFKISGQWDSKKVADWFKRKFTKG